MSATTLEKFNPFDDLPPDFFMIIYGIRRVGKTTTLLTMLESMKKRFENHSVHIWTETGDDNPVQWKNFPMSSVHTDVDNINTGLGELIDNQREAVRNEVIRQVRQKNTSISSESKEENLPPKKKRKQGNKRKQAEYVANREEEERNDLDKFPYDMKNEKGSQESFSDADIKKIRRSGDIDDSTMPHILVILDDVVNNNSIRHSSNLNKLAVSGRHIFITAIVLSQCVCGSQSVPPAMRINADFVGVIGNPRSQRERQLLSEQYLTLSNGDGAARQGLKLLGDVTSTRFKMLIISVTNTTASQYRDFLFTYGPVPKPPNNVSRDFRLGTSEQWEKDSQMNREPLYTNKDLTIKPGKTEQLTDIDSGRFFKQVVKVAKGPLPNVRAQEFLEPYF